MKAEVECQVMIWFGRPIEPRRVTYPKLDMRHTDPPLDVDEISGWLDAWQLRKDGHNGGPAGWYGQCWFRFPTRGLGTCLQSVDWFPAARLRRV